MIAERDVAVPMRDGVKLSIDIYRPDSSERFPALLAFSIYNKDLQGPDVANALPPQPAWSSLWAGLLEAGDTKFFVSRGYVHVIGSPRGVGKSEGGGSREWDCYDLIEWIAAQPWSADAVVMVGDSYYGWLQWAAAATSHHLRFKIFICCPSPPAGPEHRGRRPVTALSGLPLVGVRGGPGSYLPPARKRITEK